MVKSVYIEQKKKGYSHPKCYLSFTNGCSNQISGEHCISLNLLEIIEQNNKAITISGTKWIPKGYAKSVGKNSLESNILCKEHNSNLSPFDTEIGKFVSAILEIDKDFVNDQSQGGKRYFIDGTYIERWLVKVIVGLIDSNQITSTSGSSFIYKNKLMDIICSSNERYPLGWGLYFSDKGITHHSSSFELLPLYNPNTNELLALKVKFNGFEMSFLMGKLDHKNSFGLKRIQKMIFKKNFLSSEIIFNWRNHKAEKGVNYTYAGKYNGSAPGHDLPKI